MVFYRVSGRVFDLSFRVDRFRSLALYEMHQRKWYKVDDLGPIDIPVSVLVPAHNEELSILKTVESLVALEYATYEIIVVDDGSSDQTAAKLIKEYGLEITRMQMQETLPCQPIRFVYTGTVRGVEVTLIMKENGGKADSLNAGINVSRYPYFCAWTRTRCCKPTR